MSRDNRQIDGAAFGDFGDTARPSTFREARQELDSRGIAECFEQVWIKEIVDRTAAFGGLLRVHLRE